MNRYCTMSRKEIFLNSWTDWLLVACVTLNNTILSLFCCSLLTSPRKWLHVLLFTVMVPALLIPLDVLGISDISAGHPIRTILSFVYMCCSTLLIFKDSIAKKLLILFLGAILAVFSQMIVALPAMVYGFFDYSPAYIERNAYFFIVQIGTCFSNGACCFFCAQWIKHRNFADKSFRLLSCFVIVQMLLLNAASLNAYLSGSLGSLPEWLILAAVCAVSDLAVFYILKEMDRKIRLEAEAKFYEKQLSMQLDLYRNFSAYTDGLQQVRRRLVRELAQVCTALDCGDYDRVFDGSRHLQGDLEKLRISGFCRNSLLNAVLFMKKREMEALGISFEPVVQLEESTFVKRSDLCRIVSNLLGNAVEACAAVPAQRRLIRFTCMPVKRTFSLKR